MEVIGTLLKQKVTGDIRWDWEEIHVPRKEYRSSKQASHVYMLVTEDIKGGQQIHLPLKKLTTKLFFKAVVPPVVEGNTFTTLAMSYTIFFVVVVLLNSKKKMLWGYKEEQSGQTVAPGQNTWKQRN